MKLRKAHSNTAAKFNLRKAHLDTVAKSLKPLPFYVVSRSHVYVYEASMPARDYGAIRMHHNEGLIARQPPAAYKHLPYRIS